MQNVLKASGMNMTPEVYQAYALVKSGAVLLGAIPCMFLFPLLVLSWLRWHYFLL